MSPMMISILSLTSIHSSNLFLTFVFSPLVLDTWGHKNDNNKKEEEEEDEEGQQQEQAGML